MVAIMTDLGRIRGGRRVVGYAQALLAASCLLSLVPVFLAVVVGILVAAWRIGPTVVLDWSALLALLVAAGLNPAREEDPPGRPARRDRRGRGARS